ncbi:MAG TPA: hypothetical protein VJQ43_01690 [Thermoplasmata archaeon]|nr:hypothetical protein [Thermoplasmata archaeon]
MGIVVVGVVLLILGAVLLFVPVVPQAKQTIGPSSSIPGVILSVSGVSLTGSIPVSVSWSSTGPVTVGGATCAANCESINATGVSNPTIESGTSGSFTLNQPNGGSLVLIAFSFGSGPNGFANRSNATTTFTLTTALSTVGSILLIVGILLLIVGLVLKSKKAKMAASAPAANQWVAPTDSAPATAPPASPPT